MAAAKRTRDQREAQLPEIAALYLQGKTMREIGQRVGLSARVVHRDLEEVRGRWRARATENFQALVDEQVARLDKIEAESWDRFYASQREQTKRLAKEAPNGRTTSLERVDAVGDPRWLQIALQCVERRCRILGLDKQPHQPGEQLPAGITLHGNVYARSSPDQRFAAALAILEQSAAPGADPDPGSGSGRTH